MKITINAAMTVDGKIATVGNDSAISSIKDLKRVHQLRASVDAIVVGVSTVLSDDPMLTVRLAKGKNPVRVIVDSTGRIPLESRILKTAHQVKTIIAVTKHAPKSKISAIRKTEAAVVTAGATPQGNVNLKQLFSVLNKMGLRRILVEGGGELNWSVMRTGMVDELIVTVAPRIVGGRLAITLVEGDGFLKISEGVKLDLKKIVRKEGGEILLHYTPVYRK